LSVARLGLVALGLILAASARAQSLSIVQQPPPPGRLRMGDLWNLTVVNPGPGTQTAFLRVQVRSAGGELALEARTGIRDFLVGSRTVTSRDLAPIEVLQTSPGANEALARSGSFPDGDYAVCVDPLAPDGSSAGTTACMNVEVATVVPPLPMLPDNGGETSQPFIVWTWFMQPATASGEPVACDLRVAEMLPGQTPEEALRRNPPVLLREHLRSSAWQTNEATRALRSGQKYAWQLIATVSGRVASESEIWTFTYRAPESEEAGPSRSYTAGAAASGDSTAAAPADSISPTLIGIPPVLPPWARVAEPAVTGAAPTDSMAAPAVPRPVEWHVAARTTVETANRPGTLSDVPERFALFEVNPTISLYGSPLGLSLLLATGQGSQESLLERGTLGLGDVGRGSGLGIRQRIDSRVQALQKSRTELLADSARVIREDLDRVLSELQQLQALQQLEEPTQNPQELQRLGLLSQAELNVLRIPSFGFGSVSPDYGPLFLSAVTLQGGMVEYNPGRFYWALAAGTLPRVVTGLTSPVTSPDGTVAELNQDLYTARVGLGRKSGTHVVLSGLYARDDRQSQAILGLVDPSRPLARQENVVLGLAGRAREGSLVLDGSVQASVSSDDRDAPEVQGRPAPAVLRSLFGGLIRENSASDWSGELRGALDLVRAKAKILSSVRFVGPGYITPGARALRRDNLRYDGSWDQSWQDGRLTVGAVVGIDRTGVVLPQSGTSNATRLGLRAVGRPSRLPAVELSYTHNGQDLRAGGAPTEIENRSDLLSARIRQTGRVAGARYMTMLLVDRVVATSNDTSGAYNSTSASVSGMVSLPSRLGLVGRASHSDTHTTLATDVDPDVWSGEGSLNWAPNARLDGSAGATYAKSGGLRQMGGFLAARFGLGAIGALDVQWSYNDAQSLSPAVRGFVDRVFRVQFLTSGPPSVAAAVPQ
jgi:hypothetical protein